MPSKIKNFKFGQLPKYISQAELRIRPFTLKTPLLYSDWLSQNGNAVYLKMESEQHTGSFKARGSMNKVLLASSEQLLVTASTGNHAQGMARALQQTGRKGIIFMPENADESKKAALSQYGTNVRFHGHDALETEQYALNFADQNDAIYISPYNDLDIIAGQGTIGIELSEDLAEIDYVFVTIGGGGLASGIASYLKSVRPEINIIGCLPERSPDMYASVQAGKILELDHKLPTLSDGSAGGIEQGAITFDICAQLIDEYCLVSEESIASNIRGMIKYHHRIVEGAAAVAIAGFQQKLAQVQDKKIAIVICGGNIAYEKLLGVLQSDHQV